ncbi:MAG: cyclic nucleotide-binding domain-containing protein [Myxococcota bacterium]|nr:cyclic nucleotide-binding domain-containing protein [Myxococcota bacterium]
MHWKVRQQFISRADIFSNLGAKDLKVLAKSCTDATYLDGDVLCRQGERGITAYIIVSGSVRVETERDGESPIVVAELGQGAMVGELSVIDGAERVATVRAVGEVEALVLTQWSMLALLKSRPSIAVAMLPIVVQRFRETTRELWRRDRESASGRRSRYQ